MLQSLWSPSQDGGRLKDLMKPESCANTGAFKPVSIRRPIPRHTISSARHSRIGETETYVEVSISNLGSCMSVSTRVGTCRPDKSARFVANLLDDLPSSHHGARTSSDHSCVMAHAYEWTSAHTPGSLGVSGLPLKVATVVSGIPSSKYISLLASPAPVPESVASGIPGEIQNRGASSAACTVNPRRMFKSTCT